MVPPCPAGQVRGGGVTRARPQRKGPLKRVVKILRRPPVLFAQGLVLLECGHQVKSNSVRRARCDRCSHASDRS